MTAIRSIGIIELSSKCNLSCEWCVQPIMTRPKVLMSEETFQKALDLVRRFRAQNTQGMLGLSGIGESLLHPDFIRYAIEARRALPDQEIGISTNGHYFSAPVAGQLVEANIKISLSIYTLKPKAIWALSSLKSTAIHHFNLAPATHSHNWAGQINWPDCGQRLHCWFQAEGCVAIQADGTIATCCYGAHNQNVIGDLKKIADPKTDPLPETHPTDLCRYCHHDMALKK